MDEAAKTAEGALDQLTERLVLLADKIAENAGPAGEAAWSIAMLALRLEASFTLAAALIAIVAAFIGGRFAKRLIVEGMSIVKERGERYRNDEELKFMFGGIFLAVVCGLVGFIATIALLTSRTWITAISPEAGLALRILNGL